MAVFVLVGCNPALEPRAEFRLEGAHAPARLRSLRWEALRNETTGVPLRDAQVLGDLLPAIKVAEGVHRRPRQSPNASVTAVLARAMSRRTSSGVAWWRFAIATIDIGTACSSVHRRIEPRSAGSAASSSARLAYADVIRSTSTSTVPMAPRNHS